MLDFEKVKQDIDQAYVDYRDIEKTDEGIYIGFDVAESEDGDSWNEYCYIQDELRELGYELYDVYTEHDFVGGFLKEYTE